MPVGHAHGWVFHSNNGAIGEAELNEANASTTNRARSRKLYLTLVGALKRVALVGSFEQKFADRWVVRRLFSVEVLAI